MTNPVSYNIRLTVRDLDRLRELMPEMIASAEAEVGTLAYRWYFSEDGATCHVYERYADADAVMVHLATFGERFAEGLLGCVEVDGLEVYDDPGPEARAALAGLGAVFLRLKDGFGR